MWKYRNIRNISMKIAVGWTIWEYLWITNRRVPVTGNNFLGGGYNQGFTSYTFLGNWSSWQPFIKQVDNRSHDILYSEQKESFLYLYQKRSWSKVWCAVFCILWSYDIYTRFECYYFSTFACYFLFKHCRKTTTLLSLKANLFSAYYCRFQCELDKMFT